MGFSGGRGRRRAVFSEDIGVDDIEGRAVDSAPLDA